MFNLSQKWENGRRHNNITVNISIVFTSFEMESLLVQITDIGEIVRVFEIVLNHGYIMTFAEVDNHGGMSKKNTLKRIVVLKELVHQHVIGHLIWYMGLGTNKKTCYNTDSVSADAKRTRSFIGCSS